MGGPAGIPTKTTVTPESVSLEASSLSRAHAFLGSAGMLLGVKCSLSPEVPAALSHDLLPGLPVVTQDNLGTLG